MPWIQAPSTVFTKNSDAYAQRKGREVENSLTYSAEGVSGVKVTDRGEFFSSSLLDWALRSFSDEVKGLLEEPSNVFEGTGGQIESNLQELSDGDAAWN